MGKIKWWVNLGSYKLYVCGFVLVALLCVGCSDTSDNNDTAGGFADTGGTSDMEDSGNSETGGTEDTNTARDTSSSEDTATSDRDTNTNEDTSTSEDVAVDLPEEDAMSGTAETDRYRASGDEVVVSIDDRQAELRTYTMTTTAELRDNEPADKRIVFSEESGQMTLRSGHDIFDALFAMAIEEVRQNSVSQISDGAFNNGAGVPCNCFETGAKWNYVWTRDTAYAVDLGLALIDPIRARNSLNFKLAELKQGGGDLQIVQDTGSGGSWPVSSDRVVWALGAWEVLKYLDGAERTAFRDRAYEAMVNTIAIDRAMIFDPRDGLYKGEQSFLDWREQSYPSWTADDVVHLGMSRTLSTNVGHAFLLNIAAKLADERGDADAASRYNGWSEALVTSIQQELWLEDAQMFSAMKTTELDQAPTHKFDLLGIGLSILTNVATPEQARTMLSRYPHTTMGPPVLWPQQPLIPIYHNRGIWPFVTAYTVLAARQARHDAVFDHDLESLIRGAALNLSNMENLEFISGRPWVDDGPYSGPVVNSRRQLWSVAGYVGAIVKGVFGLEVTQDQLRFQPYVTPRLRNRWFFNTDEVKLNGVLVHGHRIDVTLKLPPVTEHSAGPAYVVQAVTINGDVTGGDAWLTTADLSDTTTIEITLLPAPGAPASMTVVEDNGDFTRFWAPREPSVRAINVQNGLLQLTFESDEEDVVFHIWRNGEEVATGLNETTWTDLNSGDYTSKTYCYAIEAVFNTSGHRSHHSPPTCYWGDRIQDVSLYGFRQISGGYWGQTLNNPHYVDWGEPDHALEIAAFQPNWTGKYLIHLVYGNGAGPINTGITASVKTMTVYDNTTQTVVASGPVVMPHFGDWERWGDSSFLEAELDATRTYRISLTDGMNMSYLDHFVPYTGGEGGGAGSYNFVNITAARFLPMSGTDATPSTSAVTLDGTDDLAAFGAAQQISPGAQQGPDDRFAMVWDDRYLYLAVTSQTFDDPFRPFNLYLEGTQGDFSAPSQTSGIDYSDLTPTLPFAANLVIGVRPMSDTNSGEGPWNGVWRRDEGNWTRLSRLEPSRDWWSSPNNRTISMRIPLALLGSPTRLRVAGHVVNAVGGNEWKGLVPASHTPWSNGGSYYEIDLGGSTAAESWMVRP